MNQRVDFLLVTTADVERDAVLRAAVAATTLKHTIVGGKDRTYYSLGEIGGNSVYMVQTEQGSATPGGSLSTLMLALDDLQPSFTVMLGMAFGMQPQSQRLGTLLISHQVQQYEVQRIGTAPGGGINVLGRGDKATASANLLSLFRAANADCGNGAEFGLLLSGEKLVDNVDYRDSLSRFAPEALGGEMEGGGLYVAAHEKRASWIIAKAICDWADGQKAKAKRERQRRAATTAAEFVIAAIKLRDQSHPHFDAESRHVPITDELASTRTEQPYDASAAVPVLDESTHKLGVPMQLPQRVVFFSGRDELLRSIVQRLRPQAAVTLCGPGGIGKTAIVVEILWRLASGGSLQALFSGGVIFYGSSGNRVGDFEAF